MLKILKLLLIFSFLKIHSQTNLITNSGFEFFSSCPTFGAQWNVCNNWNNVNLNIGVGAWGTPDYFNTCGSGGTVPPATFAGTCTTQSGNAMMALVLYNSPFPQYREYLSTALSCPMQPGNTYTLSFWLSNGTGIKSPYTIRNIGAHFSAAPLSQSGWGLINVVPQCEIITNVISPGWTQYTFTVNPTSVWNYITIGAFRPDVNNNPTLSFPNPGGPGSVYANYFLDNVEVLTQSNLSPIITVNNTSPICAGASATLSATGATSYTWIPGNLVGSSVFVNPAVTSNYTVIGSNGSCSTATATTSVLVVPNPTISIINPSSSSICMGTSASLFGSGALTYTWQPGNINSTSISVTPSSTTIYTLSGTNAAGCVSNSNILITVIPNPTITINPLLPGICLGNSATLTASGANNYTWIPTGNTTASVVITPTINSTYTINGTTGVCSGSALVTVSVNATPTISTSGNSPICAGTSATLSAIGATSYTWNPGNLIGSSVLVNPTTTTNYTVIGSNGSCTASATKNIVVIASPTILTLSSPSSVCQGASASLLAAGALTYTWQPGNIIGSFTSVTPVISTTYTVSGTNASGCVSSSTLLITVNPNPTLTINPSTPTICLGNSATLTANGALNYTWTPSGNTNSAIVITPTTTTTYTVNGDDSVCSGSTTVLVSVIANPTVTPSVSNALICNGSSATFSAIGATSYIWNPGNLTGTPVVVSPTVTTVYTVTGTSGSCTDTKTISITVINGPTVTVVSSPTVVCSASGNSATLNASGAISYTWSPGAFISSSLIITPTVTSNYSVTGTNALGCTSTTTLSFSVTPTPTLSTSSSSPAICAGSSATLSAVGASSYTWNPGALSGGTVTVNPTANNTYTVTGSNGNCTSTATVTIVVNANPTITASSSPTVICSGSSSTLSANGALTYTWSPGLLTGQTVNVTPTATTVYTVTGTNASGCTITKTVSILVNPTPTLTIISTPTAICRGSSATLTASGATNYTWLPGGSTATSIVVSPTINTIYTLLGNSGNCSSSKTFTLVVRPLPNVTVFSLPPVICKGASTTLFANGANSYTWNPGSLTGNTVVVSPSVTTIYTVTGANQFGCTRTATTNIVVNPTPTITTTPSSTLLCSSANATLTSTGALTYVYNPGAITGSVAVVSPTLNTTYTVTGVNNFGCTNTKTITIAIGANPTITASSSATIACNNTSISLSATGATNYTWTPISLSGSSVVTTATNSVNTYTVIGETGGCFGAATLSVLVIDCNNSIFGITKAAGKPVLVNNSLYDVTFTITAVNASSLNLTNVSLNEDLNAAFPFPSAYFVVNQPVITSQNSSLTVNPLFDGGSQISLTAPGSSTLLANKRDTVVFTVRIDPKGYFGPFKNSVIGFADILNSITLSDSSNNGFSLDPDGDGDPTNNDTVTVINLPLIDLFIPNGFTPDGDGKNDVFFIKGLNGRPVKLTIFNRWGNKVYEKSDYDNSWNGYVNTSAITLGADKVPAATYYYIIEFLDGDKESRTGFVVVQY